MIPIANAMNLMDCKEIKRNRICNRHATFFSHMMRRERLEHLVPYRMTERKCSRGKQQEKMLNRLTNWPNVL